MDSHSGLTELQLSTWTISVQRQSFELLATAERHKLNSKFNIFSISGSKLISTKTHFWNKNAVTLI